MFFFEKVGFSTVVPPRAVLDREDFGSLDERGIGAVFFDVQVFWGVCSGDWDCGKVD